jgi:hypothetical protein
MVDVLMIKDLALRSPSQAVAMPSRLPGKFEPQIDPQRANGSLEFLSYHFYFRGNHGHLAASQELHLLQVRGLR